ncbi:glycosyltransferase [Streptomyces sp. DT24]|uniref:glycosyltransferase n=1 Tax=unclassified Streptomyces TaxID=2593676 RepID=UPI0023B8BD71|nr:glycosyltransferase [Streptomyces sp. AM 4-1-1]WEH34430.1 glycosyltransferase [Streptomyces sp. AM 4-1-1]
MNIEAIAVVIPAHNEEALLLAALDAVAIAVRHPNLAAVRTTTVVVADSCHDRTAAIARRAGAVVVTAHCRNPGRARAVGTEYAWRELGSPAGTTWIAATDADSVVPPHWLAYHQARAREGWQAVVGTVVLPTADILATRHQLRYEATRPPRGGPWHHPHVHGANLGVSAEAYRDVGGFPPLDVGEDRALVAALSGRGHRILRTPDCPVLTSPRLRARARGGFADDLAALLKQTDGQEAAS